MATYDDVREEVIRLIDERRKAGQYPADQARRAIDGVLDRMNADRKKK
ncbi:hypothetical protein ACFUYE_21575 [Micromonospora humida]